jgi:hypothetical protein
MQRKSGEKVERLRRRDNDDPQQAAAAMFAFCTG